MSLVRTVALLLLGCLAAPAGAQDPLDDWGLTPSTGAAAGYLPDAVCAECHVDKAESFAEMGMAKSFYRATPGEVIERLGEVFHHEPSDRYYRMDLRGGHYVMRRWRRAPDGAEIDVVEMRIDWILGSGHHSRTYLHHAPDGTLIQMPLAWYSQGAGKWQMTPGFEFAGHLGLQRVVPRRCMSCHNAFPEVPERSDMPGHVDIFPAEMPEGIGCQRCHGPGAEHVRRALGGAEVEELHAAIVHPGKLPREELYSICYGCHMQPTVAVNSQLVPGRGIYSFRPGERLEDYLTHLDIVDANRSRSDKFEINHHPYRLEQSPCFIASQGALGCLTCHDPHVKIAPEARAAHYRKACLSCHETDAADLPVMTSGQSHPALRPGADCTTCHMPERRTQDVIHVTMTDHRITRDPGPAALLTAPIPKIPADVLEVFLLRPDAVSRETGLIQRILGVFSNTGRAADYAADVLEGVLDPNDPDHAAAWLELALSRLATQDHDAAIAAAETARRLAPDIPGPVNTIAKVHLAARRYDAGLEVLDQGLEEWPDMTDLRYNRGVALTALSRLDEARAELEHVVSALSIHWKAERLLARIAEAQGRPEDAIAHYLRALAIEPRATDARPRLVELLKVAGRIAEADRHRAR